MQLRITLRFGLKTSKSYKGSYKGGDGSKGKGYFGKSGGKGKFGKGGKKGRGKGGRVGAVGDGEINEYGAEWEEWTDRDFVDWEDSGEGWYDNGNWGESDWAEQEPSQEQAAPPEGESRDEQRQFATVCELCLTNRWIWE